MAYLVDAANLGGVLGGPAGARDRDATVRYLLDWARDRGRVVVVFDGLDDGRLARRYGALEIVWSGPGLPADDVIVQRLARGAAGWTVITDDRELARRCRDAGAAVLPVRELAQRVARPHQRSPAAARLRASEKPAPSAADRALWSRIFRDDD